MIHHKEQISKCCTDIHGLQMVDMVNIIPAKYQPHIATTMAVDSCLVISFFLQIIYRNILHKTARYGNIIHHVALERLLSYG